MASDQIILAGFAWALAGVVLAVVAAVMGRPFFGWRLYAVAFFPLALYHLIFGRPRLRRSGPIDDDAI